MTRARPAVVPGFEQLYDYRARLLDRLEQQPAEFARVLAAIPAADWQARRDDLGRTIHHVVAHVRFLETLAFLPRIRAILDDDNALLIAYPTHHWADEYYDPAEPMPAILTEWSRARAELVALLRPQAAAGWTRTGFHPPSGARTLQWWAERAYNHAREHLDSLAALGAWSDGGTP
jgi:hypothetical protein